MLRLLPASLVTVAVGLAVAGCSLVDVQTIRGSGTIVTEEHALEGFDALDVSRGWDVSVAPSDGFAVTVSADDNVGRYLEVGLDGSTLRLDIDDGVNLRDATVEARIAMPAVRAVSLHSGANAEMSAPAVADDLELRLTGGSELVCSDVESGTVTVELAGGSELTCAGVTAHTLEADLTGGSGLRLDGAIGAASIDGSGSSDLDLGGLELSGADVRLSGGSEADIAVSGVLEADIANGSTLRYTGDPVLGPVDVDAGSTIEARPS